MIPTIRSHLSQARAREKMVRVVGLQTQANHCPKDARSRRAMANPFVDFSIVESVGTKSKLESAALDGCTFAGNLVAIKRSQRTSVRIQTDYRIADKFHFLQCLRLQAQQILLRRIIEFAIPYHNHLSHFFADIPSRFHEPVPAKPKSPTSQSYITKKLFQKVWVATPSKKNLFFQKVCHVHLHSLPLAFPNQALFLTISSWSDQVCSLAAGQASIFSKDPPFSRDHSPSCQKKLLLKNRTWLVLISKNETCLCCLDFSSKNDFISFNCSQKIISNHALTCSCLN